MPRFYFDIRDGDRTTLDSQGVEFPTLEAAHTDLMDGLAEITKDIMLDGTYREIIDEVRDEADMPVFCPTVEFDSVDAE